MLRYLLVLLLTTAAWCRTPEEVVRKLYETHRQTDNMRETVRLAPECFTPGFLGIFERALAKDPNKGGAYVDSDVLVNSQGGWGDFALGVASYQGKDAVVPLTLWSGLRSNEVRTNPKLKASWPTTKARVHLTDVGQGYQVRDIEFLPHSYKIGTTRNTIPRMFARQQLEYVLNYKPAKP